MYMLIIVKLIVSRHILRKELSNKLSESSILSTEKLKTSL